jgi:hypothetical protein
VNFKNRQSEGELSCPYFIRIFVDRGFLGAIPNSKYIKRNCSRLSCFFAFFPQEAKELLASGASSGMSMKRTREQLEQERHFRAFSCDEVLLWIAQRLDIALNIAVDIKQAYKTVPIY